MNCLEFRREKLADPGRLSDAARAHASACAACSAFERDLNRAERRLERALETPVPEDLVERVLSKLGAPPRPWRAWAVAAGIFASLGSGFFLGVSTQVESAYARLAIEHVAAEPEALASAEAADAGEFRALVRNFGGTLKQLPGRLVYFECCPFEDGIGWHVVFETRQGLATLLVVPGARPRAPETAATARWSALAEPIRDGYYAIVTETPAATAAFEKALRSSIAWET